MDRILSKLGIGAEDRRSAREGIAADKILAGSAYRNQKLLFLLMAAGLTPVTAIFGFSVPGELAMAAGPILTLLPILSMAPFYALSDYAVYGERQAKLAEELAL